jgi:hypothetical protein
VANAEAESIVLTYKAEGPRLTTIGLSELQTTDDAVRKTVLFTVNARLFKRQGHWMATTTETGIVTYGATREEAESLNGDANIMLIRMVKRQGAKELDRFMSERAIAYVLDEKWGGPPHDRERQQQLAA